MANCAVAHSSEKRWLVINRHITHNPIKRQLVSSQIETEENLGFPTRWSYSNGNEWLLTADTSCSKLNCPWEHTPMRIASIVHASFAVTMISLGTIGLLRPDFAPIWNPVPATVPARELILYLGALISLTCGIGLLVQRVAIIAARLLLATLLLWLLLFRLPSFLHAPAFEACW